MEPHTNLKLLFAALAFTISATSADSRLPPGLSPSLQPILAPSPSPYKSSSPSSSPYKSSSPYPSPSPSPFSSSSPSPTPSPSPSLDFSSELNELTISPSEDSDDSDDVEDESEPDSSESESPDAKTEVFSSYDSNDDDADLAEETESFKTKSPSKKSFEVDFAADLHATNVDPELKKICDQTDHSSLCLATVIPLVKDKPDVDSVLQVAVQAGSDFAKEALSEAKKMAEKPGTSEKLLTTLKDCQDGYDTAVENFQKSLDAFASNDVGTMRSMLSAVITYVGGCQDEFKQMRVDSPLTGYAEKLNEMASNCLALASLKS